MPYLPQAKVKQRLSDPQKLNGLISHLPEVINFADDETRTRNPSVLSRVL